MMSEWKLVDVEGIGSGYACLTLDGVSTTKSRNLIQADRGAGGDGLGFSDLGTLLIDYADRDIAGVVGITGDQGGIREDDDPPENFDLGLYGLNDRISIFN